MGKTNSDFNKDSDGRALAWFHQTDDQQAFDAFGDVDKEDRIRIEIFDKVSQQINQPRSIRLIITRIAAAILLAASLSIALYQYFPKDKALDKATAWTVYSAPSGAVRTVTLADQSVVVLRPGTKLYVPATFTSSSKRVVKMDEGEAYFTITRNLKRPFIVQSGQITTQVLGTAFNIRKMVGSTEVEVAVSHGKVQVVDQTQRLALLSKGQLLRYNTRSGALKLDTINTGYVAAWNNAVIELNNVAFKELAYVFNSRYGTELVAANADIAKLRYTLTVDKAVSENSMLKIITKIHGLFIKTQNGKIILYK